jgi:hypothetical protein
MDFTLDAEEEGKWVTINGTHVKIGKGGEIEGGGEAAKHIRAAFQQGHKGSTPEQLHEHLSKREASNKPSGVRAEAKASEQEYLSKWKEMTEEAKRTSNWEGYTEKADALAKEYKAKGKTRKTFFKKSVGHSSKKSVPPKAGAFKRLKGKPSKKTPQGLDALISSLLLGHK